MNYIISMLRKDLILLKSRKTLLFFIIFPLTMGLTLAASNSVEKATSPAVMGIMFTSYFLISYIFGLEEHSKFEVVINSFPLSRMLVVIYKYVFVIVIYFVGALLTYSIPAVSRIIFHKGVVNIELLKYLFIGYTVFFYIYLPIYFKFGFLKMKTINLILYLLIITFPAILPKLARVELLNMLFDKYFVAVQNIVLNYGVIIYVCLLVISFITSVRIYYRKEI